MADAKSKPSIDLNDVMIGIGKLKRKFDSLSKVVDFVTEEVMPTVFSDKIEDAYETAKKQLDYVMRHLI